MRSCRGCRLVLGLLFAAALAQPVFWRLGDEEFHGDESHWTTAGQQAFFLLTTGRLFDPQWREEFYLYSQPQVGKLLIGTSLAAAGHRGPARIYDYDWEITPAENRQAGRVPPAGAILAARVPGAVAGWLACLLLWRIGAGLGTPRAGIFAALLLASHPLWLANARRAGMDTIALCFGLAGVWAVMKAVSASELAGARGRGRLGWSFLASLCFGLAAGTKYVALFTVPPALAAALTTFRHHARGAAVRAAAALCLTLLVFYATNPTFYDRPVGQFKVTLDFLSTQAQEMRRTIPIFESPVLVAAEIVDRAVWPTRFPQIRDVSLPDPLVPGSYGTPIVALGAALAVVLVWRRRRQAGRAFAVASFWCATVFVLLALSVPIWWERWHLSLIPPLCLLAGIGLDLLGRAVAQARTPGAVVPDAATPDPPNTPAVGAYCIRPRGAAPRGAVTNLRTAPVAPAAGGRMHYAPTGVARTASWLLVGAQFLAALALEPSFLGKGFGALIFTPAGAAAHLVALLLTLAALVSHALREVTGNGADRGAVPLPSPGQ